jgi:hypothetical protein
MVFNAERYRFSDFLRVGAPLRIATERSARVSVQGFLF